MVILCTLGWGTFGDELVGFLGITGWPTRLIRVCSSMSLDPDSRDRNRPDELFRGRIDYKLYLNDGTLNGYKILECKILKRGPNLY